MKIFFNKKFKVEEGNSVYFTKKGELYERQGGSVVYRQRKKEEDFNEYYYTQQTPSELKSPYEGFGVKVAKYNPSDGKLDNAQLLSLDNKYAIIESYRLKDEVITLPEKIGNYPTMCANVFNEYCKELVIPEKFCGFFDVDVYEDCGDDDNDDSDYNATWFCSFPMLPKLELITLQGENPLYSIVDNALLSKNKRVLYITCATKIGSYTVPKSVKKVMGSAFAYTNLNEIIFGKNVKRIDYGALYNSRKIKRLRFIDSTINEQNIRKIAKWSNLKITSIEKKGNQRTYYVKYDPQAYGVTE